MVKLPPDFGRINGEYHPHDMIARIARDAAIEECAKVLDEAAQDWRRIRDPGMANNAAAYAKKIRALALPRPNGETL